MNTIDVKIISQKDIAQIFENNADLSFKIIEDAFLKYANGEVIFPDKISQIFDEGTQNRINCMPATLLGDKVSGLKWVSVFPPNSKKGIMNVTGIMVLSEIETGFPIAVIDGTFCTKLRTASVGCVAAKYLAPSVVEKVGFIGAGEEAKMHYALLKHLFPTIKECRICSRTHESEVNFINTFKSITPDVKFIDCHNDSAIAADVDIVITAISGQAPVLKASDIRKGSLYIHVGGWEDEYGVALKADKIVCDNWEASKHRTQTICRMYKEGLLNDESIYANLDEIVSGKKQGRTSDDEFIYFNSVGLSFIDLNYANVIYKKSQELSLGLTINMVSENWEDYSKII